MFNMSRPLQHVPKPARGGRRGDGRPSEMPEDDGRELWVVVDRVRRAPQRKLPALDAVKGGDPRAVGGRDLEVAVSALGDEEEDVAFLD